LLKKHANIQYIEYKINNKITAPELRVLDEQAQNLGVFSLEDAIKIAKEKKLDLIEIAPNAQPPVARIMSFDKFRYQKEKEERKQKNAQKGKELKTIRITPRSALNDLEIKAKKTEEFLEEGHRVEITLFLRGREKANKEWGLQKLESFLSLIKIPFQRSVEPKVGGRGFVMQINKK